MELPRQPAKLCSLQKWPNYEGYGFDLVTRKNGMGHYVSMVHSGGPAEATNLQQGDWIIEVNSMNVENLGHAEVIQLIKNSEKGMVKLLVIPPETEKWRRRHEMVITSNHPDLVHCFTPQPSKSKISHYLDETLNRISRSTLSGYRNSNIDLHSSGYHRYSIPSPPKEWPSYLDNQSMVKIDDKINGQTEEVSVQVNVSSSKLNSTKIDIKGYSKEHNGDSNVFQSNSNVQLISKDQIDNHSNLVTAEINSTSGNGKLSHVTTITILDGEFFARLCKVKKEESDKDFGFKLDSLSEGHFLREIDADGPAARAGIQEDDRLIEVNNVNVEYTNHRNLVNMIRNSPNQEITLLVVDKQAFEWMESRNIRIHHGATSLIKDLTPRSPSNKRDSLSYSPKNESFLKSNQFSKSPSQCKSLETASFTAEIDKVGENDMQKLSLVDDKPIQADNNEQLIIQMHPDAPSPRLCTLVKKIYQKYGFTLNSYQKDGVKLIAELDGRGIANAAGLKQWDRLIEVNGVNINNENHAQIKARIESSMERLQLLVIPDAQYGWYEGRKLVPKSNQSNIIKCSNELNRPNNNTSHVQIKNGNGPSSKGGPPTDNHNQVSPANNKEQSLDANLSEVDGKSTRSVANGKIEKESESGAAVLINEYIERSSRTSKSLHEKEKEEQLLNNLRRLSAKELRSKLPTNKRQAYELSSNLDFEEKIVFFNNL